MEIKINRQSVSMSDDASDHVITYTANESTKFSDIFEELIKKKYFPTVSGNNVVWTMFCGGEDLMSWNPVKDRLYSRFVTTEPTIISMKRFASSDIYFRFYSSARKRAEYIFRVFNGSKFHIWHDGFMDEYGTYDIPLGVEEEWRKSLKQ